MYSPNLYSGSNMFVIDGALNIMDKYLNLVKGDDKKDRVILDAGCNIGSTVEEVIHKYFPGEVKKYVGIDIDNDIIELAKKKIYDYDAEYFCMDFERDYNDKELLDKFDHAFSLYFLHWVPKQRYIIN